jgi:two-component system, LytTR family, sensor kinase
VKPTPDLPKSIIPPADRSIRKAPIAVWAAWWNRHRRVVLLHLLAWAIHFIVSNLLLFYADLSIATPQRTLVTYSLVAMLFYANTYWAIGRHIERRQYLRLITYTMVLLLAYIGLRYLIFYIYFPIVGFPNQYSQYSIMLSKFIPDSLYIALQYLFYSYGYWFAIRAVALERQKRVMQTDLLRLEQAQMQSELAFLRVQLNPHFLFNTLNFFYAEAFTASPRLAEGILQLATMMRKVTEFGQKALVPVAHELDYIRHYIDLQQLRFGDQMHLSLTVDGEEFEDELTLPPLILISLIENVFKYGELADPANPAQIRIWLTEHSLAYLGTNLKKEFPAYSQGGVGLSNIDQQLTIHYGNHYSRKITETESHYTVEINIQYKSMNGS